MKTTLALVLGTLCVGSAFAGDDLAQCLFANGAPMHPGTCEVLRKREQEVAAGRVRAAEREARERAEREQRQAEQADFEVRRDAVLKELEQKRLAEQHKKRAAIDKENRENERRYAQQAKAAADKEAALKADCGNDYKAIAIGMPIQRAQKCVANLKLTGQLNRADGVVSTYQAGRLYAHVMDGKIVSWGR